MPAITEAFQRAGFSDLDGPGQEACTDGRIDRGAAQLHDFLDVFHFEQTIIHLSVVVVVHGSPYQGHFFLPSH